ncbi:NlpC/P60 family protein [Microtetraspora fusca]|uniref:NlpC/P60 family protein n=1 Tax=Microtetraspora fusca TaxID=1997 RepID=A0ABW6VDT0_MICFU
MAEGASAGRIYADVLADTSGFRRDAQTKLKTELKDVKAKIKVELDRSRIQAQAQTAAREASKAAKAQITVQASRTQIRKELKDKLAEAAKDLKVRVAVEVNTTTARRKLNELTRDLKVDVEADTTRAAASIAALRARQQLNPIRIGVEADSSAAERTLSSVGDLLTSLSKFPAIASGIMVAAGALANLAGGLYAITASASQAVGVLAAIPNLAGVAVQGLGALLLGFSGIGAAVKELGKAETASGAASRTAGTQRAAALDQVRAAQQRLTDARRQAAQQVADDERNAARSIESGEARLASAHQATQRALAKLNAERLNAIQRMKDLALEVAGGKLDEEAAKIALEHAERQLQQLASPGAVATDLQRREADLAFRQAQQRLAEIQARNEELAKAKAKADAEGVDGDERVVAAQQSVLDAQKSEVAAAKELARIREDAARNVARAQADAARRVRDAQQAVAQAMAGGTSAAAGQTAAFRALNNAMSKLSPAGQAFARFLNSTLQPRFEKLRNAVQQALLPPLQAAITQGLPLLDVLQKGLVDTGRRIGALARGLAATATQPLFQRDIGDVMASNNRALSTFGDALNAIVSALRHVAVVAGPTLLEPFARWVLKLSEAAEKAAWVGRETGTMAAFFERAKKSAKTLGRIIADFTAGLFNLGKLARPAGDTLLGSLAAAAKQFRNWTGDPANAERIQRFFENTVPVMRQFGDLLNRVISLFVRFGEITGGDSLSSLFWVLNRILDVLEAITKLPGGGAVLSAILTLSGAGLGLGLVAKGLGGILGNVAKLAKYTGIGKVVGALTGPLTGGLGVGGVAKLTAKQAGGAVKGAAESVALRGMYAADAVGGFVGSAASKAGGALKRGAGAVGRAAKSAGGAVASGAKRAGGAVARRVAGRGAEKGAASVASAVGGQAVAAGIEKAAAAARRGAAAVGSWTASLAKSASSAILGGLSSVAGAIGRGATAAWGAATAVGSLVVQYGKAALAAAANTAKTIAMAVAQGTVRAATALWTAAQTALNFVLDANPIGLIVIAIAALVAGVVWAYRNVKWFRDGVDAAFRVVGAVATWLWKTIIVPAFQAIGAAATWLWQKIISPAFKGIGAAISWATDKIIKPAFAGLKAGIDAVKKGFEIAVSAIKTAWNKIGDIAKAPVRFVIDTVLNRGILAAWNKVASFFNIKPDNLQVPMPRGFATGGVLPGYTPGRDVHTFTSPTGGALRLSGGEAVMRPEWVRAVGEDYINASNAAARRGGAGAVARMLGLVGDPGPGFADGGIIGGIKSFFGQAKDWFVGGIRKAASVVVDPVLSAIEHSLGGSDFARGLASVPRRMVNGFLNWLDGKDEEIGGPGRKAVALARTQIGVPYVWGGTAWGKGLDCSGLVQQAWYRVTGKLMPRTTYTQKPWLTPVTGRPREGDIGQPHPGHEFLYSGNNKIIEAPYTGARVREVPERPAWWGRPPASFLKRDHGGPLERGWNAVLNATGRREWVITPEVVDLLGGERAVQALNNSAARLHRSTTATAPALHALAAVGGQPQIVQHIHPQPRQSEHEIGVVAARKLGEMLR